MRKLEWLALAALLVVTLACGTSGSTVGSTQNCSTSGSVTTCNGNIARLNGTHSENFDANIANDSVFVEITLSVEGGTVRVSIEAPDGTVVSEEATPGNSVSLSGDAEVSIDEFTVTMEAVGGEATGVAYTASYQVP